MFNLSTEILNILTETLAISIQMSDITTDILEISI